ncbi:MAG: preprotein translocase subunit SecG [Alphaproteobacteria bacterium]|nr:preprotein translocase subunit SecG [Alphaproteobacteria bacterium]
MLSVLLGLHFALTLAIIGLILLQKHDSDGALGSSGGGAASGMFSVRGQANILTKSTAILMTIFMINCLVMAKIAKNKPTKVSVIDKVANESILPAKEDPNRGSAANSEQTTDGKSVPTPAKPTPKDSVKK